MTDPGSTGDVPAAPRPDLLRRVALAVAVLDDVDLEPGDEGVVLHDGPALTVTWDELRRAVAGADPEAELARRRVWRHLRGRRLAADTSLHTLRDRARPVGLPRHHLMHPGLSWVRERVLGGVLDLGLGFVGLGADPDEVEIVPQSCLDLAGHDLDDTWGQARSYLERMGAVAAERLAVSPERVLRPIGDCDVVTLLGSRALRAALSTGDPTGMRAAAVPMRRRGWVDLSHIDPAFALAAAAATDPADRAFDRPLLITADEVTQAPAGGRPAGIVLLDPAVASTTRSVRFR